MSDGVPVSQRAARWQILFVIAAACLVLYGTSYDTGIPPDAMVYLSVAHNLNEGIGWTDDSSGTAVPLTRGGPMLPLALAGLDRIGFHGTRAARALNTVSFALMMIAFLALARRIFQSQAVIAGCAAAVLLAEPLAWLHVRVLTEPLYFALALSSMALTVASTSTSSERRRRALLLAVALLASCAAVTRYVGVSLVAAGVLIILLTRRPLLRRLMEAGAFAAIGLAPLLAWFVRNTSLGGRATGNPVTFHLLSGSHLYSARTTIATWMHLFLDWSLLQRIPVNWKLNVAVLFIVAIAVTALAVWRAQPGSDSTRAAAVVLLYAVSYFGVVCLAISVIDFSTPLDFRILAPVYPLLVLLAANAAVVWSRRIRFSRPVFVACAIAFVAISAAKTFSLLAETHQNGCDFNGRAWRESTLVAALRRLPPSVPVVTNGDDAYALNVGRLAVALPMAVDTVSAKPLADYTPRMQELEGLFRRGAVLAEFSALSYRTYLPDETYLKARFDLCRTATFPDGALLRKCPASPASSSPVH
jgi:hypothetical protein